MGNNSSYVFACIMAVSREVMNTDWRLSKVDGEDP
jgi:hypothetical protein